MKRIIFILLAVPILIFGQNKIAKNHAAQSFNCQTCHSCEIPTKENPCLKACPREGMIRIDQKAEDAPRVIVINKIKETDLYEPVKFSHLAHAEMSDMSGDCRQCHHYNPPGNVIGCSDCHDSNRKRTDVSKPDLKGAYHRQCVDCHRQWSGQTECLSCHAIKGSALPVKAKEETKGRIHPEIKAPDKIRFKTETKQGKLVTFYHSDHTNLFGIECKDCHSNETCIKCHAANKPATVVKKSVAEKHKKCSDCHDTNKSCRSCHSNKETGSFNHKISTGFDLSKFHSKLTCERCHTNKKFVGLKKECAFCHGEWKWNNFDHKITGLLLDEMHAEVECSSCHKEPTFEKPDCSDCHDDKTYPKEKPGKLIKKKS